MSIAKDMKIAKTLLDPYLKTRQVGQHMKGTKAEVDELYRRGAARSQSETIKLMSQKLSMNDMEYWTNKGASQRTDKSGSGLWCDGSAAIVISHLTQAKNFGSTLTVVEQGRAKMSGHWWVIANLTNDNPTVRSDFGKDAFTIDIWGALELRRRGNKINTCVFKPAKALYSCGRSEDANRLKVRCTMTPPYNTDTIVAIDKKNVGKKKRLCFITTATCESMGYNDDCEVLTLLRKYRDEVLAQTDQGRRDIEEYYRIAPTIVSAINGRANAEEIYRKIYVKNIQPSVNAITQKDYDLAYYEYRTMVSNLKYMFKIN